MIDRFVVLIAKILYGKTYFEGYGQEPIKKDEYMLTSVFPNEKIMNQVNDILKECNN